MLSFLSFVIGLFTACSIWATNLKIKRSREITRWGSLVGILALFVLFFYSIYYIKAADYALWLIIALSIGITVAWVIACCMFTGLLIIVAVGAYWLATTLRKTSIQEICYNIKADFKENFVRLKSWIDGEE